MSPRDLDPDSTDTELARLRELLRQREQSCQHLTAQIHQLQRRLEQARDQHLELLQAQRALAESRDRYADLYDFSPVASLTIDGQGLLLDLNLTASALLGRPRQQLENYPLLPLVAMQDRPLFLEHLRRCRSGNAPVRTALSLGGGVQVPVELVSQRSQEGSGGARFRTVAIDLRERLASEEARVQAAAEQRAAALREQAGRESSEAKDRFLAMLSHELRAPLTPALLALDALDGAESEPEQRQRLGMVRRNLEAQTRLIDDLLDMTRLLRQQLRLARQPCDLHRLASEVADDAEALATRHDIALERQLQAPTARIDADPGRIQQVIRNLLSNALKFTPHGGRVRLSSDHPRPGWVRLEVSDTGRGFHGRDVERIFEPFEQLIPESEAGLGLGLAISKRLIAAHGGQLCAYSSGPGTGARFSFELRLSAALPSEDAAPRRYEWPEERTEQRVLLVEDHEDTAQAVAELLEHYGYRVRTASTIAEALSEAKQGCDVVLSDLQLPDGSGYELLGQLPPGLPALALSGLGSEADVERSNRAGFAEHLVKPISASQVLAALRRVLARARSERAP
jgi:PAS domain S-box-containing protein